MKRLLLILVISYSVGGCVSDTIPVGHYTGDIVENVGTNRISQFLFDSEGYVWMTSPNSQYLFKTDEANIIRYTHDDANPGSLAANKVNAAIIDEDGVAWFATQRGVDRYDRVKGCFDHIGLNESNSYVVSIAMSPEGKICIATRRNILELYKPTGIFLNKIEMPFLPTSQDPSIIFDSSCNLWVQNDNKLECYRNNYDLLFSKSFSNPVDRILFDGIRYMWLLTADRLVIIDTKSFEEMDSFELYPALAGEIPQRIDLVKEGLVLVKCQKGSICVDVNNNVLIGANNATGQMRTMLEHANSGANAIVFGPGGGLWVGLEHGGFVHYPSVEGPYTQNEDLCDALVALKARNYVQDRQHYWFVSNSRVFCYDITEERMLGSVDVAPLMGGFFPFSIEMRSDGTVLVNSAPRRASPIILLGLSENDVPEVKSVIANQINGSSSFLGKDGILLAGSGSHLLKISPPSTEKEIANPFNDNACYASHISKLSDDSVLICYTDHCPIILHPRREEVRLMDGLSLEQVYFSASLQDRIGNIWLASTDNGLFKYSSSDERLVHVDSFQETDVVGLATDGEGNIFVVGASNRVYLFREDSINDPRIIWNETAEYPSSRCLFSLPDHSVALIGESDYILFNSKELSPLSSQRLPSHIILSSGKKVLTAFSTRYFPKGKATVCLDRNEEGLNLHIGATPGRYNSSSYSYMYDINGFKSGPRESFDNAFIPLYGVSDVKNKVTFWVRDNNRGTESDPFTIIVKMNPFWWEIVIPILFLMLLTISLVIIVNYVKKKREVSSEKTKREMIEKMNNENLDFFANISHEFRTPLTLIHGAVVTMGSEKNPEVDKAYGVIKRNTDRLLKLVSQMLDFNKLDHGVLKLNVKLDSVSDIIKLIKMNFEIGAAMKNITLSLNSPDTGIMGWVDRDKLEKVMYNLLSNALKYTPPGGFVNINVEESENHTLHVSISDTGIGIPEEDLDAVFDRFYQTDEAKKAGGAGIGLYYSKALVNLHHGSIGVELRRDEEDKTFGSIFSFTIPLKEDAYSLEEKADRTDKIVSVDEKEMMSEYIEDINEISKIRDKKPKLLIIDDDYEVVYYLKSIFADSYNVSFRFDAMSGYKCIEESVPDVIICDVMMVDVDGVQLCRMVKNNIAMSHIPFIMLTAKSTMEDQIKSLGVGADAYVVKPFNSNYLKALIKSMLENRNRVKETLAKSTNLPPLSKNSLSSQDISFLENLYSAMENSIQNGELDIDTMAETLGVSRSKFYYKVKALTEQTPNEFFTTYKLNYSVKYLKEHKFKIAAIADMLGFSSASHYALLFKKQFGVLPSQYSDNALTHTEI